MFGENYCYLKCYIFRLSLRVHCKPSRTTSKLESVTTMLKHIKELYLHKRAVSVKLFEKFAINSRLKNRLRSFNFDNNALFPTLTFNDFADFLRKCLDF